MHTSTVSHANGISDFRDYTNILRDQQDIGACLLFRTLFQQAFPCSKHAVCGVIYRFDTGIGLKWEDVDGRRFLVIIRSAARATSAG